MCESEDGARCWKKGADKDNRAQALLFKQTSGWHRGLRIAVVSQTWFSLTA